MKSFVLMVTFLTRLPLKVNFEIKDDDFRKGIWYIPVIGLLIGAVLYGAYYFVLSFLSQYVASVFIVILYIIITGGLHLDGLADTCDAVFSCRSRERMLEIMKDSHIGTFGVVSVVIYLMGMAALMAEVPEVCLIFPVASRASALLSCAPRSYARTSGMGKSIIEGTGFRHVIFSVALTAATCSLLFFAGYSIAAFIIALIASVISMIVVFLYTGSISRKLGGMTGDVIGFAIEISALIFAALYYILTYIGAFV